MTATEPSHFPSSLTISGLLISFENEQHGSVPELFFRLFFPASRKAPQLICFVRQLTMRLLYQGMP